MIEKPPMASFVSAYGPSVTTGVPLVASTTVVASEPCRPPPNTKIPAERASSTTASTSVMICWRSSGDMDS